MPIKNMSRPKGWVKADAVRVVRNKGRYEVQIRRKRAATKKKHNPAKKNSARKRSTTKKRGRR